MSLTQTLDSRGPAAPAPSDRPDRAALDLLQDLGQLIQQSDRWSPADLVNVLCSDYQHRIVQVLNAAGMSTPPPR